MFETAEERVKLLKMGLSEKEIEMLYIQHNNFKIIHIPILYNADEFDVAPAFANEKSQMTRAFNRLIVVHACDNGINEIRG